MCRLMPLANCGPRRYGFIKLSLFDKEDGDAQLKLQYFIPGLLIPNLCQRLPILLA